MDLSSSNHQCPLLSLPNEILITILKNLSTGYDQLHASQTCRRLYAASTVRSLEAAYKLDIEILAQHEKAHAKAYQIKFMYACSYCMKLRPMHHFTKNQALKKGPRTRICLFCISEGSRIIRRKTSPYRLRQCLVARPMLYWFGLSICACLLCHRLRLCPSVGSFGHQRYCYGCGVKGRHVGVEDIVGWLRCCGTDRRTSLENVIAALDYFDMVTRMGVVNHWPWLKEMMTARLYRTVDTIITQEVQDPANIVAVGMGEQAEYWRGVLMNTLHPFFGGTLTSLTTNYPPEWWQNEEVIDE
ncbi:hypothetical protein BJ508DRAFT_313089 [Ascobolus immersus RN42]|uniref:F-box domain-containing protein n=1 Tax=Ascobolus immersus RN42 TaxID=1160509 RepID=A0A3N4HNX6_ASCIM|nr:hypothetical protein BJ508DRAFT_313089 [Ascobolus immersus RN42]